MHSTHNSMNAVCYACKFPQDGGKNGAGAPLLDQMTLDNDKG
jgi:hypothetical protein